MTDRIRDILALDDDERKIRNAVIEECAKVVEGVYWEIASKASVAAMVRALKQS